MTFLATPETSKRRFPRKPDAIPWQEWLWSNIKLAPKDECWDWVLGVDPNGYGKSRMGGSPRSTHRMAWESVHGSIPPGNVVLQTCMNRKCCRPNHLYLATERKTGALHKIPWRERLWKNVDKQPGDGCWRWMKSKNPNGYGMLNIEQWPNLTHRLAWEDSNGPIPESLCVLHKCNNPSCCRPDHLYLGTDKENALDRVKAGTSTKGEKNPGAKLTESQVLEIRERIKYQSLSAVAAAYGVYPSAISKIKHRKHWAHI